MTDKLTPAQIVQRLIDPNFDQKERERQEALKKSSMRKEEELKKKASSSKDFKQIQPKLWYDVRVEVMLPAVLTYRILAENAQQAAELIKGKHPNNIQHKLQGRKELILRVFNSGGNLLQFMKRLVG